MEEKGQRRSGSREEVMTRRGVTSRGGMRRRGSKLGRCMVWRVVGQGLEKTVIEKCSVEERTEKER